MDFERRKSRKIKVGTLEIGGGAPVAVQSMNASPALEVEKNLEEIWRLQEAGCELTRLAVPDKASAKAFAQIAARSPLPIVADIHFDAKLALLALEAGAAALRLNPGNIRRGLPEVAEAVIEAGVPVRIGVNAGSLDPEILKEEGVSAHALARSALEAAKVMENLGVEDLCLSLKASDPRLTIEAYRLVAKACEYPLHLGVTESGLGDSGLIRSAVGIGTLLAEGIGDTFRVSLTDDPVEEVRAAWQILRALGLRERGAVLVSCPGCGRTQVNHRVLAAKVQEALKDVKEPIQVAVMGCAVNGPGEAREADLGLAGGKGEFLYFRKGEVLGKVPEEEAFDFLMREIEALLEERKA